MERYCEYCNGWFDEEAHFYRYHRDGCMDNFVCRLRKRRVVQARYAARCPEATMLPTQPEGRKYCRYCKDAFPLDNKHWTMVDNGTYRVCARHVVEARQRAKLAMRKRKGLSPLRFPPYPRGYHWCGKCEGLYPLNHFERSKIVKHGWYVCKRSRPEVKRREMACQA